MPKEYSTKINLIWKHNPGTFEKLNANVYNNPALHLGPNHAVVDRMTMKYANEMKSLLPSIIGTSPLDPKWYEKLTYYWHSVGYSIPSTGKELEIGYIYDIEDSDKKEAIKDLISKNNKTKEIVSNETLATYVESNIQEDEKYKYARPININDYLLYRFALVHGDVANTVEESTKSTRIRFILSNPKALQEVKRQAHVIKVKANAKYMELLGNTNKEVVENVLYVLGTDVSSIDRLDQEVRLEEYSTNEPERFISVVNDKNILIRATIERYILADILKRLPDSSIIVDSKDPSLTIGGTIDEAISFFTSAEVIKVAKVNEYKTYFKNRK